MVDPTYRSIYNPTYGGEWTLPDAASIPLTHAFESKNVVYVPGQVGTRLGFSLAFDADEPMTAMFNWISSLGNLLLWYRSTDNSVQLIDIASPVAQTIIAGDLLGYGAIFSDAGARAYAAFFTTEQQGASGARVISTPPSRSGCDCRPRESPSRERRGARHPRT